MSSAALSTRDRVRLVELFSLACWEPAEEAEAAAIIDTLTRRPEAVADTDTIRDLRSRAALYPSLSVSSTDVLALLDEVRELRRILYAAVDPENGAQTAQAVRDLIQGELNAIATTREVIAPGSLPPRRGPRPQSTEKQGPGALTSFGADDWAELEEACGGWPQPNHYDRALARLWAADQANTEALRDALAKVDAEIVRMEDLWQSHSNADDYPRIIQSDAHLNGLKFARAALVAAAAAPKETP